MLPTQDTSATFGSVSRVSHAVTGTVVLVLLAIGLYFHEMPKGDERTFWLKLHISIGTLAALPLLFRVGWRALSGRPDDLPQDTNMQRLAKAVHAVLLIGITIMAISGPLIPWTVERPLGVFGLFEIPSPLPRMHDFHELLETVHGTVARITMVAFFAHLAGVVRYGMKNGPVVLIERMGWKAPGA